ncbi:MAG: nuclear transport factor 2 family protein [Ginsengibacter sp.]
MTTLEVVNEFYDSIFNLKGDGLADIINEDITFNGPFFKANGSKEFIEGMQRWGQLQKTYKILKQFTGENNVCTIYTLNVTSPSGAIVTWDEVDWIETQKGKLLNVRIYFDPRKWAKAIGK